MSRNINTSHTATPQGTTNWKKLFTDTTSTSPTCLTQLINGSSTFILYNFYCFGNCKALALSLFLPHIDICFCTTANYPLSFSFSLTERNYIHHSASVKFAIFTRNSKISHWILYYNLNESIQFLIYSWFANNPLHMMRAVNDLDGDSNFSDW